MVEGKRKIIKWDDTKKAYLREHANDSYEDLSKYFGCSIRAVKHVVGNEGIQRDERRRWTEEELNVLSENPSLKPSDFVKKMLLNRSEFQIAKQLREMRGTARRVMKEGWNSPGKELAYLLGAICSDGCVTEIGLTMTQKKEDIAYLDEVSRCVDIVWGLPVKRDLVRRSYTWKGVVKEGEYAYLGVYSVDILRRLRGESIDVNVRGVESEWVDFIERGFKWVWEDEYFWSFMGGLFDGDGCARHRQVSIGVKPRRTAMKLVEVLNSKGFTASVIAESVYIAGGMDKRQEFMALQRGVLKRKKEAAGIFE